VGLYNPQGCPSRYGQILGGEKMKKERIARLAKEWGSSSTTIAGLRRWLATAGIHATDTLTSRGVPADTLRYSFESKKILSGKILVELASRVARLTGNANESTRADAWKRSKHAEWVPHVFNHSDNLNYRGSYKGYGLSWLNPGVYAIPLPGGDAEIRICDYSGQIRRRIFIRGRQISRITTGGLLPADIYGVSRHRGVVERYDAEGRLIGLAVRIGDEWEHGRTISEIRAEIAHKHTLVQLTNPTARQSRAAGKILAFCHRMTLRRSTARSIGYCDAGIDSWLQSILRLGIDKINVEDIPANADNRWIAVAQRRALEIAVEIF